MISAKPSPESTENKIENYGKDQVFKIPRIGSTERVGSLQNQMRRTSYLRVLPQMRGCFAMNMGQVASFQNETWR